MTREAWLTASPLDAGALWGDFLAGLPPQAGGVGGFVGRCRARGADGAPLKAMTLECYPGMGARVLEEARARAVARWNLLGARLAHRYGRVAPGEVLVVALTAAESRAAAMESARFLIDITKTRAPFWKREETEAGAAWVEARAHDLAAAAAWEET